MNKEFKTYKLSKIKYFLKNPTIIFFFHTTNLNAINWLKIEKDLFKCNLICSKINNTLTKNVMNNSIYKNFSITIKGPLCIIQPKNIKNTTDDVLKLLKTNKNMYCLNVKINKKFYSKSQLKNISTFNYRKNITIMNKTFKSLLKTPYYKLKY